MSILSSTGWNQSFLDAFQAVGSVAAAVAYQKSGAAQTAQAVADAEKAKQYDLIARKQSEGYVQKTSVIASVVDVEKIKTWLLSNWLIIIAAILLLLVITGKLKIPFLRRSGGNPRRLSLKRRNGLKRANKSVRSRPVSSGSGFSRKIKGITYTSKKAWAKKMQSLRKRK